jgi:iron complex outermembrane receptor protein
MSKQPLLAIAIAAITGSLHTSTVIAQSETLSLEEVIVTARKRSESIQAVPVSVTALSAAELRNSSLRDLRDLQGFSPNLIVDKVTALPGGAAISIRGVSYQEIDKSLDPGIGVLLDGVYLGTNSGQILENFDLERVEILRGPQGTLFGKNTIGGAINIFRTAPTRELGGKVQGTLGEDGRQDIRGLLNLPLTERGGLKLFGSKLESDGYIKNFNLNDDVGGQDYESLGTTVAYDLTDDFNAQFTYERVEDESDVGAWANINRFFDEFPYSTGNTEAPADLAGLFPLLGTGSQAGFRQFDDESDEDNNSQNGRNTGDVSNDYYNLTFNWRLGDWALSAITGYIDRNEKTRLEYDANRFEFLTVLSETDYEQFSQEIRVNGSIGDVELTTGVYYWDSQYSTDSLTEDLFTYDLGDGFTPLPPGSVGTISQDGDTESWAAFASADWALSDQLTLNLGLRYTYEEKSLEPVGQSFFDGSGNPIVIGESTRVDDDWDEWSPRVGVQYQWSDDLMTYASYAAGFKSGGFFGRIVQVQRVPSYDPEEVDTYEIGAKSEWWDSRVRVNGAVFYSEYNDKQEEIIVPDATGNVDTAVLNASDAQLFGAELETTALLYDGLTLSAQIGYLDAEYDEFLVEGIIGVPEDASDLEMRNAPEWTFGANLNYVHSLFDHSEMAYNVNYRWRDDYMTIFNNDPLGRVDAAGFWDANIDYTWDETITVSVYGRNLGDERYRRVVLIEPISAFGQWNEPRNYGVTVTYQFQ